VVEDLKALFLAVQHSAHNNHWNYPESLDSLVLPDVNGLTFLGTRELPLDPWGRSYHYVAPSVSWQWPRIYTRGRDGIPGGEGEDRDIDIWAALLIQGCRSDPSLLERILSEDAARLASELEQEDSR